MTSDAQVEELRGLFDILMARNAIDRLIAERIGRPALTGHLGEFIASRMFDIELHAAATHPGSDGHFRSGPLAGRTVNIKLYGRLEYLLDINPVNRADFYLVLTGPTGSAPRHRPLLVSQVFLFETLQLLEELGDRKLGAAVTVPKRLWDVARIHPSHSSDRLALDSRLVPLLDRLAHSG